MAEAGLVTHNEVNTTVAEIQAKEPARVTVVTADNFDAYVNDKLGIDPEAKAKEELAKVEAEKATRKAAETDVEGEEGVTLPSGKKGKLNERFSELTAARKAAEEKAAAKDAEVRTEREAREKAEADANALRQKYEPVKTDPDPEPQVSQFSDVNEYAKALKEWTADITRRDDAKKAEAARIQQETENNIKAWNERQAAYREKNPDYDKKIAAASHIKVSDDVRDAIIDSEVGPAILAHFAENADVAEKIGKMTVGQALKAIGRLEATLGGTSKADTKTEVKNAIAEISKAPAPINPLRNASNPVVTLSGTDAVPANMSYEEWKKLRQGGKIR